MLIIQRILDKILEFLKNLERNQKSSQSLEKTQLSLFFLRICQKRRGIPTFFKYGALLTSDRINI